MLQKGFPSYHSLAKMNGSKSKLDRKKLRQKGNLQEHLAAWHSHAANPCVFVSAYMSGASLYDPLQVCIIYTVCVCVCVCV